MTESVTTLYRPVGPAELELIRQTGWRRFPPRLPEQPIFYPVLEEEYATRIARDWNVKASGAGFVTRFKVDSKYLSAFETHPAGGSSFNEYWVPSGQLEEFNEHILGAIEVVAVFRNSEGAASVTDWVKVYDLADDHETVRMVQRATLHTEDFGLESEVALYGSDDWWKAVGDGRIPTCSVIGVISRVFMSGHGDWPEFEIDSGGTKTQWTRFGEQSLYKPGNDARLEYVVQRRRKAVLGELEQKAVLRIFVKQSMSEQLG